jgi:hypothetical protein
MTGIILSLLATLAALVFAFYSDDAYGRAGRRLNDCERRIVRKSGESQVAAQQNSIGNTDEKSRRNQIR